MACPVLIIGGDLDLVTKVEASETLMQASSTGSLQRVADVNHMGFLEREHHYNSLITAFIAEHGRVPAQTNYAAAPWPALP